jgi:serine O-acetyltransferase
VTRIEGDISPTVPDWSRERKGVFDWDPGRSLLASIRCYQKCVATGGLLAPPRIIVAILRHRFWSAVSGADIPINSDIAGGLLIPHPNGIVIHPSSRIGPNCLIFQQVTLGARAGAAGVPAVGGHVDIGAGAKVLGPVVLHDHCVIGANAVVLQDVPAGATAVGIPARIIKSP